MKEAVIGFTLAATGEAGTIRYLKSSCNDSIYYDFNGNSYHWRINPGHLYRY